jgi:uncharacterized protein
MDYSSQPVRFTSFLVKIASRCNLACDYCYMYEHADQSWRTQPAFMSDDTRRRLAARLGEYAREANLTRLVVVFHGGEPLLAGAERIVETADWIRNSLPPTARADFSLQTNGTLLTEDALQRLAEANISVSLSLDGPKAANDLHRLGHNGESSFQQSLDALALLERYPDTYAGLIAVIDPRTPPEKLFEFFATRSPPRLDFLLPDANHIRPPSGRKVDPDLFTNWLLSAFDLWFDTYPTLPVRMFDAVLGGIAGIPSDTDAFGFGDVTLLNIETDGSYHDLDVLKITAEGMTALGCNLQSNSIAEAAASTPVVAHRDLLNKSGLAHKCLGCPEVEICGGGSVPHRYSQEGFHNPTIYCEEMLALIGHARSRMIAALSTESAFVKPNSTRRPVPIDLLTWERPETSQPILKSFLRDWAQDAAPDFKHVLSRVWQQHPELRQAVDEIRSADEEKLHRVMIEPATVLWTNVTFENLRGVTMRSIDGETINPDLSYVKDIARQLATSNSYPRIHHRNRWLELPFGKRISFESESGAKAGTEITEEALQIIGAWRPALLTEIRLLDADIQFIRDLDAHPDKAVSFSDNTTPGALYLCIRVGGGLIDPYLLADSIIHEHRHQKLYLLQREVPLVEQDRPLVPSPWREDLRPPSGLFHAVFVFVHLSEYWRNLAESDSTTDIKKRARGELELIEGRIESALPTLKATKLSSYGFQLLELLEATFRNRGAIAAVGGN